MNRSISPQLRAPAVFAVAAAVAVVLGGVTHGWRSVGFIAPVLIAVLVGLYLWARRDSDPGAVIRHQADERLATQRLKVQALVGRVLSLAVAIGYIVAVTTKTMLWPWATLLGLLAVAFLIGWLLYGEHEHRRGPRSEDS